VRERSTVEQLRQHIDHIKADELAHLKLHSLRTPDVQMFLDRLVTGGMSRPMAKKVRSSLGTMLRFGQLRGVIDSDPCQATKIVTATRQEIDEDGPVVIPTQDELRNLLEAAQRRHNADSGYALAVVSMLLFCGLRMSELRGLPKCALTLAGEEPSARVFQRADRWQALGAPKSKGSRRRVPIGQSTARVMTAWLPHAPAGELDLVFPNGAGNIESYGNFWNRFWQPLCSEAGLAEPVMRLRKDRNTGKRKQVSGWAARYSPHVLRHAYASMLIANGTTPKKVSALMGHSSIKLTMDTYGHLWPNDSEDAALATAAENLIMRPVG
jgi:integrase